MRASFVFSEVITGLRRNVTMTIAMILTTAISLGLLGGGLLVVRLIDQMQEEYYSEAEVSVYLVNGISATDRDCTQALCSDLQNSLKQNSGVESVSFENQDQVYQRFQRLFSSQPELLQLTRKQSLPAILHVKLTDPARSKAFVQEYTGKPGVDKADDQGEFLQRVFDALGGVRNAVFAVALIQALAALLLISNTIQISAFTRRTEVGIMRLVGATRWYTQLPFLLEAVVAGVTGSVLAIGGLIVAKVAFIDEVLADPIRQNIIPELGVLDVVAVSPWLLLTAVAISAITGYATLRLYVRL
jgi:cell division transport system permease protein